MTRLAILAAAGLAFAGCKNNSEAKPSPLQGSAMPPSAAAGSAGSSTAAMTSAPKPVTQEALAKRFDDCRKQWELAKWDAVQACYTGDASFEAAGSGMPSVTGSAAIVALLQARRAAFPDEKSQTQLTLVDGRKLVEVSVVTGKNTGPLKTPKGESPATGRSIGLYLGQVVRFDDAGKIIQESDYLDHATVEHQLRPDKTHPARAPIEKPSSPAQTVIAKDDAAEKANLGVATQFVDTFNKHDDKGLAGLVTDDAVWSDQAQPKDLTKPQLIAHLGQLWKGFSDLKIVGATAMAAGAYVATTASLEGTNDGDLPMMHVKKTGKKVSVPLLLVHELAGGKLKATWLFYQSTSLPSQLGMMAAGAK